MGRLSSYFLHLLLFAICTFGAHQYTHWRMTTLKDYYSTQAIANRSWEDHARAAEAIQNSVGLLNNLELILLGGTFFLAFRRQRWKSRLGYAIWLCLLAATVSVLAFSVINGLSALSSIVLVFGEKSPPMTDWRVQGYWAVQIELTLGGAVLLLLLFIDMCVGDSLVEANSVNGGG